MSGSPLQCFRVFPEIAYYTEINNLIYIYTTFPSKYFPCAATRLPASMKVLNAFLETIFRYLSQCSLRLCSVFLGARDSFHFKTLFSRGNKKKYGRDKSWEYGWRSIAVTLRLARYFLASNNWRAGVLSCRRTQLFIASNIDLPLLLSRRNICFPGHDLDIHSHEWRLGCGLYKLHNVSSAVILLLRNQHLLRSWWRGLQKVIRVSLHAGDSVFETKCWQRYFIFKFLWRMLWKLPTDILTSADTCSIHFLLYFTQDCSHARRFRLLSKLTVTSARIVISTQKAIMKTFTSLVTCAFFFTAKPNVSLSSYNVCEGDLYSKTYDYVAARCSVTELFKCNERTICRNKQTADFGNNASNVRTRLEVTS